MTLTYVVGASKDAKKTVRVVFDPPLSGYEEVKPRLMNMKVDAEEALGMVCSISPCSRSTEAFCMI